MDNIRERKRLFREYLAKLAPFEHIQTAEKNFQRRMERPFFQTVFPLVYDIKAKGKTAGFVIMGWGDNCHPDADFYVQDVYIRPDFRRQGLVRNFMENHFAKHPGIYSLLILNENIIAKMVWTKLFTNAGFSPCWLSDVGLTGPYCKQYWRKKE